MARKNSRKLSVDMHRKLSAISNCSDVSNLSLKLGMDPNDFKSTIHNILELDVGEAWEVDSDEESLSCYGEENEGDVSKDFVTVQVDRRKFSNVSQASIDSLDEAEFFEPVQIEVSAVKTAINLYQRHKKISMSKGTAAKPKVADIKE